VKRTAGADLLNSLHIYYDHSLCQHTRWPVNKHATCIFRVILVIGMSGVTILCERGLQKWWKIRSHMEVNVNRLFKCLGRCKQDVIKVVRFYFDAVYMVGICWVEGVETLFCVDLSFYCWNWLLFNVIVCYLYDCLQSLWEPGKTRIRCRRMFTVIVQACFLANPEKYTSY